MHHPPRAAFPLFRSVGLVLLLASTALAGCGSDASSTSASDASGGDSVAASAPTFHKDVAPIVFAKCASCHANGAIGPFDITKASVAKGVAPLIGNAVATATMPPWDARDTATCKPPKPWLHDARLSDAERATIAAWVAAGAPEGDPADSAGLKPTPAPGLSRVDRAMKPKVGFSASGNKDQYICFPFDPKLTADSWIQGVRVVAGNPLVAHHALLFLDPTGEAEKKAGAKGYYDGFGSCDVKGGLVAAWAPGGVPVELPECSGIAVKKGSKMVMQMHYHPLGPKAAEDKTLIELKLTEKKPRYEVVAALIGNASSEKSGLQPGPDDDGKVQFRIPAGKAAHTETIAWTMPLAFLKQGFDHVRILGVAAHMHYLGAAERIWVERRQSEAAPAPCSANDQSSLEPCISKKCNGKTGKALTDCAVASCGAELKKVSPSCVGCLVDALKTGKTDLWGTCRASATLPPGPTGSDQDMCLLELPEYSFNWQRFYTYDAPIEELPAIRVGDTLKMRCVFNNSTSNSLLMKALAEQGLKAPIDVKLGDETLDEMCLTGLYVLRDTQSDGEKK